MMNKQEKRDYIEHIKREACTPKSRLMELAEKLGEAGAVRDQKSLESIIWKLELWQNK